VREDAGVHNDEWRISRDQSLEARRMLRRWRWNVATSPGVRQTLEKSAT